MRYSVPRPSVVIVDHPSNPHGRDVDLAFYERLCLGAREQVWVLSDLAYPSSIRRQPDALDP